MRTFLNLMLALIAAAAASPVSAAQATPADGVPAEQAARPGLCAIEDIRADVEDPWHQSVSVTFLRCRGRSESMPRARATASTMA